MKRFDLINTNDLFNFIGAFEKKYPGWWWSITQAQDGRVIIRTGPSQSCPDIPSRKLLATGPGDSGISVHLSRSGFSWVFSDFFFTIENLLNHPESLAVKPVEKTKEVRCSGNPALTVCAYVEMIRVINNIHQMREDFNITSVYIGSCHTSVDSSIRGTVKINDQNGILDISSDLFDREDTLNESIRCSIAELEEMVQGDPSEHIHEFYC